MFDLFRSRDKAVRWLLGALLGLVALSMVVTLIPGFGSSAGPQSDLIIAQIGDDVLTTSMVNKAIRMQMRERQLSAETLDFLVPQLVDQMVGELSTAYQAQRMGFTATDAELVQQIKLMLPQLFQGGQFVGKEVYQQYLAQVNATIPEFEAQMRRQILLGKLQAIVFQGTIVPPKEVEAEYKKKAEKVKLAVVKFDAADMKSQVKPAQAQLEEYVKTRPPGRFMVTPKRTVSLLVVDELKLGENIPLADAALKQFYDSQLDRFKIEETIRVRHLLVKKDKDTAPADAAKAKAKAEDLLKQIRGGADFAELAKKNSDDPGSAPKGGEYESVARGQFVKEFEDVAFRLTAKEVSNLVETQFGYHIIQTLEHRPARLKPFEEVKDELAKELRRRQLFDRMPALAEQARAELLKTPDQGEQIAQKLNLLYARVSNVGAGDPLPHVGVDTDLEIALGPLLKGGVTPVVQTSANKLVVAAVHDTVPARPATLADMPDRIREAYIEDQAQQLANARAAEFQKKLAENGKDFYKAARDVGVKVIETNEFARAGQMEGIGPAAYFGEQPFINPAGAIVAQYRVANTGYSFKILSKADPDMSGLAAEREMLVGALRERKLRERRDLFEEGLVAQLVKEGKVKIRQDAIKRLIAGYKG